MTARESLDAAPEWRWRAPARRRVIVAALCALGLGAVPCPAGAATMLSDELAKLSASHGIEFKGLDKTTRARAPEAPVEGKVRVRLRALLADYNYIMIHGVENPDRVVILNRITPMPLPRAEPRTARANGTVARGELVAGARLSSGFGMRHHPILGFKVMHRGLDLAAARGTPVHAAADGVVTRAGRWGAYGNIILLGHDQGFETAYAHLASFADGLGNGAAVQRGDVIGFVGATGRVTGPHLHYEVLLDGRRVDPATVTLPGTGDTEPAGPLHGTAARLVKVGDDIPDNFRIAQARCNESEPASVTC